MPLDRRSDRPDPGPQLPRVWRPRVARVVALVLGVVVVAVPVVLWLLLPDDVRATWNRPQVLTIVVMLLGAVAVLHLVTRARIRADEAGVLVVNMVTTRRLEWAEIVSVRLSPGDPWVYLDLDDGTVLPVMGIQSSDGDRARRAAAELARLVRSRSSPDTRP